MTVLGGVRASALVERVREAADMQATQGGSSGFVEDDEIKRRIDEAATDLYDKLIANLGEDYFVRTKIIDQGNFTDVHNLPDDFYRLCAVHEARPKGYLDDDGRDVYEFRDMTPFQRGDMTRLLNIPINNDGPYFYRLTAIRHRVEVLGVTSSYMYDQIEVFPNRSEGGYMRVSYIPRLIAYNEVSENATAPDLDPIYPGIAGWEEYVVLCVAIRLLAKEESDTSDLRAERDRIEARIESLKSRRDVGRPEMVTRLHQRRARPRIWWDRE